MRIASGRDQLLFSKEEGFIAETISNGRGRTITIQDSGDVNLDAIRLQHEAHRDGVVTSDNYLETRRAVLAHTEMALRMLDGGLEIMNDMGLARDIFAYLYGDSTMFNAYVDANYDSSGDYWLVRLDNKNGFVTFNVMKDQESDNIYELADRLFGTETDGNTELLKQNFIQNMIAQNNGSDVLAFDKILDLSEYIEINRDYGRMNEVFNNSGVARYLFETLGSDFSTTKFIDKVWGGLITDTAAQAIPSLSNRVIGYNHNLNNDLPGDTAMILDTISIAKQFGFGIDDNIIFNKKHSSTYLSNSFSSFVIETLFHENFHNYQYDAMGSVSFLGRYMFESSLKDNYDSNVNYWKAERMTLDNIIRNPTEKVAFLPINAGEAIPSKISQLMVVPSINNQSLALVRTTLDTRADVFAGHAKFDYYNWFNSQHKR